ncbi:MULTISPECIES: MbtH family NRPS accessory protein [unclassified Streptomyces]|uniref:MbtH family protein n=1 Tax=unclassified Streptomyces TaxID=2593676 RepID=UPI002E7A024E|nr:MbtH family NRPS accessory protein [Streptomyces sp. JV176]MEE1799257.1 MbtH family NRPS accessory protein [Streptomyces sp. JV176]
MGDQLCTVVINEELQYATVPATWPVPEGWRQTGASGTEEECVRYVETHWTDMRPLSLRRAMEEDTVTPREHR